MSDQNGQIPISAIRTSIQEALANAERLESEAILQRGIAKALEALIAKSESVQPEPTPVDSANGFQHANGNGHVKPRPTTSRPSKAKVKTPLTAVLIEILKAHPDGITKNDVASELVKRGRSVSVGGLISVLSQKPEFVNEKLGPNYFLWKYVENPESVEAPEPERQDQQVGLGFND